MQTCCARSERARSIVPLAAVLLVAALTPAVRAQAMRDLIEAALDEKITQRIEIPEQPIRDALAELEKRTGLHFELHKMAIGNMNLSELKKHVEA